MADGKIVIDARISTAQAEKDQKKLQSEVTKLAHTYKKQGMSMSEAIKKANREIRGDTQTSMKHTRKTVRREFEGAAADMKRIFSGVGSMLMSTFGVISFVQLAKECIELGSAVEEVQNVVDTAFGSMAYKMEEFSEKAITSYGISQLAAKKTGSNYMAMARGMGIAEDAASDMAISLTALSADVASFYNIDQEEAATKLKSVFTGETETLKDLGVVMTQTNLEQYALTKGIKKGISAMTQAELTTLRYNYVLDRLGLASGDFIRTQDSWANQTRILSEQMKQLGANIGTILTTVLLPAVKMLNEIVASLVTATGKIVDAINAIKGNTMQNNATASSASSAADAEYELADGIEAAANAAKKAQAGFDELNILQSAGGTDGSSDGGSTGTGSATTSVVSGGGETPDPESAKSLIQDITKYAGLAVSVLGGLKLGGFVSELATANVEAKTLKDTFALFGKKLAISGGITLAVSGAALEGAGVYEALTKGLDTSKFGEMLLGGAGLTGGLSLALSKLLPKVTIMGSKISGGLLGGAIGGIVAGIPMFITGIYDSLVSGIDWLSATLTAAGATAAGAGIGAIIGSLGGPIGTGIGALIGLIIGLVTDLIIWLVQNWDSVVATFSEVCGDIGEFFSDLWADIQSIWKDVSGWFDTNVIQPVVKFFTDLWEDISSTASDCWNSIVEFFSPAIEWFSELFDSVWQTISDVFYNVGVIASGCWEIITAVWNIASTWFAETVVGPVSQFFSDMWTSISGFASDAWVGIQETLAGVASWIDTNVIQPVAEFFSGLWEGFTQAASDAWEGVKEVFSKAAEFFSQVFSDAWKGIVKIFSVAGEIFTDIKDGILSAFKTVVNGIIKGLNNAIALPFDGINTALRAIRNINIMGLTPFSGLKTISVPKIPYLAQGAVIPPNREFLAVLGDQSHGTNIEAPLSTIQEAVAIVMEDMVGSQVAGFEAVVSVLQEILEAVLGIEIDGETLSNAVDNYKRKMAVARGGT